MGNSQSIRKINFEDVQYMIKNSGGYVIINTLPVSEQDCLLPHTMNIHKEEELVNRLINAGKKEVKIHGNSEDARYHCCLIKYHLGCL